MKNEENESSASNPLTPVQDNRIFDAIPVRPAPWTTKTEAGSPMNKERALGMFRTANQRLYDKLCKGATCSCGNCYLCVYNFFAAPVAAAGDDEGDGSVEGRLLFASDVCRNQQLRIGELERRYALLLRYADHLRGCASYTNSACTCGLQNAMRSFDVHDSDAAALRSGEGS